MSRREELYKNLINETSRLYGDAYEHDEARRGSGEGVHAEKARHAEEPCGLPRALLRQDPVPIVAVSIDKRGKFCKRGERHPCKLVLAIEGTRYSDERPLTHTSDRWAYSVR